MGCLCPQNQNQNEYYQQVSAQRIAPLVDNENNKEQEIQETNNLDVLDLRKRISSNDDILEGRLR
jgi:hypothetical protein